jgi:UPF0148 protein
MSKDSMKKMADLLRNGAKMLGDSCPECGTPIFQLKSGEIICPRCQRPIKYLEKNQDLDKAIQQNSLELTLINKIHEVQKMLENEKDTNKIKEITETLLVLLEAQKQVKT